MVQKDNYEGADTRQNPVHSTSFWMIVLCLALGVGVLTFFITRIRVWDLAAIIFVAGPSLLMLIYTLVVIDALIGYHKDSPSEPRSPDPNGNIVDLKDERKKRRKSAS